MHNALLPAGLPTQPRQGIGARFLRRLGGAVRNVIAGPIALAVGLQRPAAPQSNPSAPQGAAAPSPRKPRARRPRAASPVPPAQPAHAGRFACWFRLGRRQPALLGRLPLPEADHAPFTLETHPGLTPEVCEFLNTPAEECDPELLRLVLAVLAHHIADGMPPELGRDAKALFSTMWGRLGAAAGEARPDAAPPEQPAPEPVATPTDAAPAAASAPPAPLVQAPATEPANNTAIVACETTPNAASPARPVPRRGSPFDASRWSRHRRRPLVPRCRASVHRRLINGPQRLPPRRLYYAACAGPP